MTREAAFRVGAQATTMAAKCCRALRCTGKPSTLSGGGLVPFRVSDREVACKEC